MSNFCTLFLCCGLLSPVAMYAYRQHQRPQPTELTQPLFQGIHYSRSTVTSPRANVVHRVEIDLTAGITPLVSHGNGISQGNITSVDQNALTSKPSTLAQTTREFVESSGVQVAINGNYFYAFREKTPWNFYPHTGDRVYTVGDAIGDGERYGAPKDNWPALCFHMDASTQQYQANIAKTGTCPDGTKQGVAGRDLLVDGGQAMTDFPNPATDKAYSRVAVGVDATGYRLWLVVVDGKQPFYSEGMLLDELATVLANLGAETAIALDGGGSSTLVIDTATGPNVMNAPMHVKWPLQERPVANHLGFFAPPSP